MQTLLLHTNDDPIALAKQGFTGSWSLNASRAIGCNYVVICEMGSGAGILVGKVKGVMRTDDLSRFDIYFSHFAHIETQDVWNRTSQNPVGYTAEKDVPIDFNELSFSIVE